MGSFPLLPMQLDYIETTFLLSQYPHSQRTSTQLVGHETLGYTVLNSTRWKYQCLQKQFYFKVYFTVYGSTASPSRNGSTLKTLNPESVPHAKHPLSWLNPTNRRSFSCSPYSPIDGEPCLAHKYESKEVKWLNENSNGLEMA